MTIKRALPLLLLLFVPLLSGCFGATGVPLPMDRLSAVRDELEELDRLGSGPQAEEQLNAKIQALESEIAQAEQSKDRLLRAQIGRKQLLLGYCWERRGVWPDAQQAYAAAARSEYGSVALFRTVQVAEYAAAEARINRSDPNLSAEARAEASETLSVQNQRAVKALEQAANFPVGTRTLLRTPPVGSEVPGYWTVADIRHEAHQRLDKYYRDRLIYRVFSFLVAISGGPDRNASYIIAIVLLAVIAKLITTPLSSAQFRSMRAMQAIQPELKKIQEKYKDDKQAAARAQMELFKKHNVNPASSCLPMLVQMPILIWVYYGIRYFIFRFEGVHFLYLKSLANPDVIAIAGMFWPGPLLLLYGLSMYFSQKLLATPAATPEQQQQQKLMAYMMPVLLVMVLKNLPAAFILYWLLQNVLMTGHQYLLLRPERQAAGGPDAPAEPKGGQKPPPPKAIQRLAQGTQSGKKKRKGQERAKK